MRTDFANFVTVFISETLVLDCTFILESAEYLLSCSMLMVNVAFIAGSSKQGNAFRASAGSKSVRANTLEKRKNV